MFAYSPSGDGNANVKLAGVRQPTAQGMVISALKEAAPPSAELTSSRELAPPQLT